MKRERDGQTESYMVKERQIQPDRWTQRERETPIWSTRERQTERETHTH